MSRSDVVALHPPWKQAAVDFMREGFKAGDVISHEWLREHLEVPRVDYGQAEEDIRADLAIANTHFVHQFKALEKVLLQEHQLWLQNVRSVGYRVVSPAQQTAAAMHDFRRAQKAAFRNVLLRVMNVDLGQLTNGERRANADALAKISMLRSMERSVRRRLPAGEGEKASRHDEAS